MGLATSRHLFADMGNASYMYCNKVCRASMHGLKQFCVLIVLSAHSFFANTACLYRLVWHAEHAVMYRSMSVKLQARYLILLCLNKSMV